MDKKRKPKKTDYKKLWRREKQENTRVVNKYNALMFQVQLYLNKQMTLKEFRKKFKK